MPETYEEVGALQTECDQCGVTFLVAPPVIPNRAISVTCNNRLRVLCPYCKCYSLKEEDSFGWVPRDITDEYDTFDLVYHG